MRHSKLKQLAIACLALTACEPEYDSRCNKNYPTSVYPNNCDYEGEIMGPNDYWCRHYNCAGWKTRMEYEKAQAQADKDCEEECKISNCRCAIGGHEWK